jgi:hypothetical protein
MEKIIRNLHLQQNYGIFVYIIINLLNLELYICLNTYVPNYFAIITSYTVMYSVNCVSLISFSDLDFTE